MVRAGIKTLSGLVLLGLVAVPTAAVPTTAAPASASGLRVGVSAPIYESPGGAVPVIVTVYGVPQGYTVSISGSGTNGARATCAGKVWRNSYRRTASRKCYLQLPTVRGYYNIVGRATLMRDGAPVLRVSAPGRRPIQAKGHISFEPLSLARMRSIERCSNTTRKVWLTFDDGGSYSQVTEILSVLRRNDVRGRFFFTGSWAADHPGLLRKIKKQGHFVANHTRNHEALNMLDRTQIERQIHGGIRATTRPRLLRPPYASGAFSHRLNRIAAKLGYTVCRWTVDTYDWDGASPALMAERIRFGDYRTPPVRPGGNILMHGTAPCTSGGLQRVIRAVRSKGLHLDRLR